VIPAIVVVDVIVVVGLDLLSPSCPAPPLRG
jgi:hypothetical protein